MKLQEKLQLEKKDPDYFSDDLKKILSIITTKKGVIPVGSFSYKIHKYPSDIDIFEHIEYCCHLPEIKQRLVAKFKEMAENITRENEVFLGDFKAGFDRRYFKFLNLQKRGLKNDINISDLISPILKNKLVRLLDEKRYGDYKEEIRILYTIRWTRADIIRGNKKLVGGKIIKLSTALTDKSDVKIDLIGKVDGRFKEITNYFYVRWRDSNGKIHDLTKKPEDRIRSLEKDIKKYSKTSERNSLKFAKRLWLRSILLKHSKFVKLLNPLFSGDAAIMNQVKSEAESLRLLLKKHYLTKNIKEDVMNQIDEFKSRLSYVNVDLGDLYKNIDNIMKDKDTMKELEKIIILLSDKTEEVTTKFLDDVGISYKQEYFHKFGYTPSEVSESIII